MDLRAAGCRAMIGRATVPPLSDEGANARWRRAPKKQGRPEAALSGG